METRQFGKRTARVHIIVLGKCLRGSLIIFLVIIAHTQHVKRLFRFISTFKNGNQLVQQRGSTTVLAFCEVILCRFILVFVVCAFQQLVVFSA